MSTRSERSAAGRTLLLAACALAACAGVERAPEGRTTAAARAVADPICALAEGVEALEPLALAADEGADPRPLETAVRDLVALVARREFDGRPDVRGALRVDLLYVALPPEPGDRAAALKRARAAATTFMAERAADTARGD